MAKLLDRCKVTTATTGTGTITLGSAVSGFRTFANAGAVNGDVVRYVIEDGASWEIGSGTYTATGPTLTRSVVASSNSNAAINLSGSAVVFSSVVTQDLDEALPKAGGTMTGGLTINPTGGASLVMSGAGTASVEIGRVDGSASTPIIDFHSGATAVDFDSRLLASGGTGVAGGGTLSVTAATFQHGSNTVLTTAGPAATTSAIGAMSVLDKTKVNDFKSIKEFGTVGAGQAADTAFTDAATWCRANPGRVVLVPDGHYPIATGNINVTGATFIGPGGHLLRPSNAVEPYEYYTGAVITLTHTTNSPFLCGRGTSFEGLNFWWPEQAGTTSNASTIVAYPALFTNYTPDIFSRFRLVNNTIYNAYIVIDAVAGETAGDWDIFDNSIFPIHRLLRMRSSCPEYVHFSRNFISTGVMGDAARAGGTATEIMDHYAANCHIIELDCSANAYALMEGMFFWNNFVFGPRNFFLGTSGGMNVCSIAFNKFDGIGGVLDWQGTGQITNTSWRSNDILHYPRNSTGYVAADNQPVFKVRNAATNSEYNFSENSVHHAQGHIFDLDTTGRKAVIRNNRVNAFARTTTVGTYDVVKIGSSIPEAIIQDNDFDLTFGTTNTNDGINVASTTAHITGNNFTNVNLSLKVAAGCTAVVRDNRSRGTTHATVSITNAGTIIGTNDENTFDKPIASMNASSAVADNGVTNAKLRDSVALSVIGRSANSTGDPADIAAGSDGDVLRRSGTTLGFGTIATAGVADDAISNAKLRNSAALSVIGNATNGSTDPADIAAGNDGEVLRRSGTALGFGTLAAAAYANNTITVARLSATTGDVFFGRDTAGTGAGEEITATAARTILNVADGANNYVHPTGDGNLHVPATLTTNNNKVLTAGATAGSLSWVTPTTYTHPNHTGEVTSTGDGATVIAADAVTNTKLANMAQATMKGRQSGAGTGDPEDLTATQARTILNVADGANAYTHPNHTGAVTSTGDGATAITNNAVTDAALRDSAALSVIGRTSNTTGDPADIVAGTDGHVLTRVGTTLVFAAPAAGSVADDSITNLKLANMATGTIKGRNSGTTGDPEDLSATQVRTIINVADGATVNSSDATLLARANHTGTQSISTIWAAATSRFFGRITAAGGAGEELTGTQATTLLDTFTSLLKGLVPASGGGTVNFLRADGSFAQPVATDVQTFTANGTWTKPAGAVRVHVNLIGGGGGWRLWGQVPSWHGNVGRRRRRRRRPLRRLVSRLRSRCYRSRHHRGCRHGRRCNHGSLYGWRFWRHRRHFDLRSKHDAHPGFRWRRWCWWSERCQLGWRWCGGRPIGRRNGRDIGGWYRRVDLQRQRRCWREWGQ